MNIFPDKSTYFCEWRLAMKSVQSEKKNSAFLLKVGLANFQSLLKFVHRRKPLSLTDIIHILFCLKKKRKQPTSSSPIHLMVRNLSLSWCWCFYRLRISIKMEHDNSTPQVKLLRKSTTISLVLSDLFNGLF